MKELKPFPQDYQLDLLDREHKTYHSDSKMSNRLLFPCTSSCLNLNPLLHWIKKEELISLKIWKASSKQ